MPVRSLHLLLCLLLCWITFTAFSIAPTNPPPTELLEPSPLVQQIPTAAIKPAALELSPLVQQHPAPESEPAALEPLPTVQHLPTSASTPTPTPAPVLHDIQAPFAWYIWQGYQRNGQFEPGAKFNCGPASVAMALRYGSNNMIQVSPEAVRDVIPHLAGTQKGIAIADLVMALDHWHMPTRYLQTLPEIEAAIARDHIVLVSLHMSAITPAQPDPASTANSLLPAISGRYYAFDQQHALVLKGIVQDRQTGRRYFVAYDPDVWAGNAAYYYRGDARYPKGLNRLYAYEDIVAAMQPPHLFEAIELLATPAQPIPVPEPVLRDPVAVAPAWCYQTANDVADAVWCE